MCSNFQGYYGANGSLSPAAQAVMDATFDHWPGGHNNPHKRVCIAAALRAAVDRVVPEPPAWEIGVLSSSDREVEIRRELRNIADELEGKQK